MYITYIVSKIVALNNAKSKCLINTGQKVSSQMSFLYIFIIYMIIELIIVQQLIFILRYRRKKFEWL